jgi:hypothetical protein
MRLKVKDVNFTNNYNWLFKLSDGFDDYYIFDDYFYNKNRLKSPITKKELDYLDIGHSLLCEVKDFGNVKVVIEIDKFKKDKTTFFDNIIKWFRQK